MKRLTKEIIEDRMVIYEELIGHLTMDICETDTEKVQAAIVRRWLQKTAIKFYAKHKSKLSRLPAGR
jgi:hypothetical protein